MLFILGISANICFADNNECHADDDYPCDPELATCTNIPGSYICDCNDGYQSEDRMCIGKYQ